MRNIIIAINLTIITVVQKNEIENAYVKLQNTYKDMVVTLSRAVDARDPYKAERTEPFGEIQKESHMTYFRQSHYPRPVMLQYNQINK